MTYLIRSLRQSEVQAPLFWRSLLSFSQVGSLCCVVGLAQAQGVSPVPLPGASAPAAVPSAKSPVPLQVLDAADAALAPAPASGKSPHANFELTVNAENPTPVAPSASAASAPEVVVRRAYVEPLVTVRATATDNARLTQAKKKEIYVEASPEVKFHLQNTRVRLDGAVGGDQTGYLKDAYPSRFDPRGNFELETKLVDKMVFFDAAGQVDRRAPTPFGVQSKVVDPEQKVLTKSLRLSPHLAWEPGGDWKAMVRSDSTWTRRSADESFDGIAKIFSQNTQASLMRDPLPLGGGVELADQSLRYNSESSVLRLQNVLGSVGYAFDSQWAVYALAGKERSSFAKAPGFPITTQTDADWGLRLRWVPIERSELRAEARQRFFGHSFNLQWNHRSPFLGIKLSAVREPNTQPEVVTLSGNLVDRFDAIFRSRGFNAAQRQALVRDTLSQYGLPKNVSEPTNLYLNQAQLSTTLTGEVALLGRRTATVLSAYSRRLEYLKRKDDEAPPSFVSRGDLKQRGFQVAVTFRMTPSWAWEAGYRFDRSAGLVFDVPQVVKENLLSMGTTLSLSPKTKVSLGVQHLLSDQNGSSTSANSATVAMTHRF